MRFSPLRLLSPKSLLIISALITCGYAILHLAGWRKHMSILSGTISEAGSSFEAQACQAVLYIGAYFGVVLLVPILLLAAMLQFVVLRLFSRRGPAELS